MKIKQGLNVIGICKGISTNDGGYHTLGISEIRKDEFGDDVPQLTRINLSSALRDKLINSINDAKGKLVIVNFAQRMQRTTSGSNWLNSFCHQDTEIQVLDSK